MKVPGSSPCLGSTLGQGVNSMLSNDNSFGKDYKFEAALITTYIVVDLAGYKTAQYYY